MIHTETQRAQGYTSSSPCFDASGEAGQGRAAPEKEVHGASSPERLQSKQAAAITPVHMQGHSAMLQQ